jgi:hypothetical protein
LFDVKIKQIEDKIAKNKNSGALILEKVQETVEKALK